MSIQDIERIHQQIEEENRQRESSQTQNIENLKANINELRNLLNNLDIRSHSNLFQQVEILKKEFANSKDDSNLQIKNLVDKFVKLIEKINTQKQSHEEDINSLEERIDGYFQEIEEKFTKKEFVHVKDMHDFIHSNPTIKKAVKKDTFERYIEIYKKNHNEDLYYKFDHDKDSNTPDVTLVDALNDYIESL